MASYVKQPNFPETHYKYNQLFYNEMLASWKEIDYYFLKNILVIIFKSI